MLAAMGVLMGQQAFAQTTSELPAPKLSDEALSALGMPAPKLTPLNPESLPTGLPVRLMYNGPKLSGLFELTITVVTPNKTANETSPQFRPVAKSILYLSELNRETDAVVSLAEVTDGLQIQAVLKDENQNLVLETAYPLPVLSNDLRILTLRAPEPIAPDAAPIPNFTAVETISGKIILPQNAALPVQASVHIQLLENALAGGTSVQLVAQDTLRAVSQDGAIPFTLNRGMWDRLDDPDLAFKVWVTDFRGRKIYVLSKPVSYNGPDIDYVIRLDGLRQGKATKLGQNLNPDLLAQTLVQGEAQFDPVKGIPSQARLKILLRQDRGDFNLNPILAQQTLILRGMETRIPFSFTTDSTHFDPYAPAPFLSVALTDSLGRVYYESGEIRAREGQNSVRLYPR